MAAQRQERLLERQRGAGTRQIKNAGFNLLLPGQDSVANASLQPQKSGRSRKTPQPELLPQKSARSRKTPQPELPPQRSTRRTPAPEELPAQPSSRRPPNATNAKKRGRPKVIREDVEAGGSTNVARDYSEGIVPKRRKLNKARQAIKGPEDMEESTAPEVQVKNSQPDNPDAVALPSGVAKKRKKRKSIGQQSGRRLKPQGGTPVRSKGQLRETPLDFNSAQPAEPIVRQTPEPPEYSRITTPAFGIADQIELPSVESIDAGIENEKPIAELETGTVETNPRKRKRKIVVEQAKKRGTAKPAKEASVQAAPLSEPTIAALISEPAEEEANQKSGRNTKGVAGKEPKKRGRPKATKESLIGDSREEPTIAQIPEAPQIMDTEVDSAADERHDVEMEELQKKIKPRKKRKSIGQQRPKRKSTDLVSPKKAITKKASITKPIKESKPTKKSLAQPPSRQNPRNRRIPTPESDEAQQNSTDAPDTPRIQPAALEPKKKRGRPRKTDAPLPHQPKPTTTKTRQTRRPSTKPTAAKTRKPPKNTIPITIYAPPSPTASSSDSDAMIDPLSHPPPRHHPPQAINAIDVLSQITHEMLSKTSTSLASKAHSDPSRRAEHTRRKKTTDLYAEELSARLYQLTTTLNQNLALGAQVRKSTAEERGLRKEIKALEAERERVGRRKEELLEGQKKRELEELLSGIAGAVKKGWEMNASEKERAAEMLEG